MGKKVSISKASEILGVSKSTLRRWDEEGRLKPIRKEKGGHRRYDTDVLDAYQGIAKEESTDDLGVAIYCRVSSADQKSHGDLERQKLRLLEYCATQHYRVDYIMDEVGSGMNDKRKKLRKLMKLAREHKFNKLVIERCDRLTRFNYEFLVEYFESHGVQIEYLDAVLGTSFESDLVKDILSIIMVFSAKLYGKRSKENKLKMKELKQIGVT
jgi:putative resolvase